MSSLTTLVLASHNPGKVKEFSAALAPLQVLPLAETSTQAIDEPHASFLENALEKARCAARLVSLPVLADDSGLCVSALQGAPGVHSQRFSGGDDAANNRELLRRLQGVRDRRAYFYCVLVFLLHPADPAPLVAEGCWWGEIATVPEGSQGFGYDPVFHLPSRGQTAAQLTLAEKNQISHRAQAIAALRQGLARRGIHVAGEGLPT